MMLRSMATKNVKCLYAVDTVLTEFIRLRTTEVKSGLSAALHSILSSD